MKEVQVHVESAPPHEINTKIVDIPRPSPGRNQVLIRVIVAGTNPKDWKYPIFFGGKSGENTGDDIAGFVEDVGSDVTEFKKGDRVAAFHEMGAPAAAFAEYAVAWASTTFHIPSKTTFEEAATIPLAAMTAATGLFCRLGLPEPWNQSGVSREHAQKSAVLVYGGATAVGAFAIKLLKRAKIHPIIAVAGRGIDFVESILDESQGDVVIDYRQGDAAVVRGIRAAVPSGKKLNFAFDTVSEGASAANIQQVLEPHGRLSGVLPSTAPVPDTFQYALTNVGDVHGLTAHFEDFGHAWFRLFSLGLGEGWLHGHPFEVIPGGLAGVEFGLRNLRDGRASAVKYVYRVEDTPGL